MSIDYVPAPSVLPFLTSTKFISLIMGPVGSTKTTAAILKIAYMAKRVARGRDGMRRSRAAWIRNTREQLSDTSIPDFLSWFPDGEAGLFIKTGTKFILRFDDVECEVLFRGLDDSADVRRLLSLQLTFGIMDEFREINKDVFEALTGRVGRYPNGKMVPHRAEWGVDNKGHPIQGCVTDDGQPADAIWGASNPPDMDTFWETFITTPPANTNITIQPSAMSEDADWLQYLKPNYYENLVLGKSQDWIDVYVNSEFGKSLSGKPVFRSFNKETHVAKTPLKYNPLSSNPLVVGFDCTGLNPAAVIGQVGYEGRLFIFRAVAAEDMGALRFIREVLKPMLINDFQTAKVLVVIDPAGMNRGNDERNVKDLLQAEGLKVIPARTNSISARIAVIESYLTRNLGDRAMLQIDPLCQQLVTALQSKYRYKLNTRGEVADTPDKTHPWADIVDSMQYLCLYADGGAIFGSQLHKNGRREVKPTMVRWAR